MASAFLFTGCATAPSVPAHAKDPMPAAPADCFLQPGDLVRVTFLYWPELDGEQIVRPDGMITLPFVNDVDAAGLRPIDLREELLVLYADKLKDPDITVMAEMTENRRVFVGGELNLFRNTDGLVQIPLVGQMTALAAILQAGGFRNRSAQLRNVVVVRRMDGKHYARTINMREVFKNPESEPF